MARVFVPMMCRVRREGPAAVVVRSNRIGSAMITRSPASLGQTSWECSWTLDRGWNSFRWKWLRGGGLPAMQKLTSCYGVVHDEHEGAAAERHDRRLRLPQRHSFSCNNASH